MKNLLNIDDKVIIRKDGCIADGAIANVETIQKFSDGTIYYTARYKEKCPTSGTEFDQFIQFKNGEYEKVAKEK